MTKLRTFLGFLDLLFQMLFVMMILPHHPSKDDTITEKPGVLSIEVSWPADWFTDVDLWVLAPKEHPVGWNHKAGRTLNLVRDDTGSLGDFIPVNVEHVFTRGLVPGEYIVNLHLYGNVQGKFPVPVKVQITYRDDYNSSSYIVFQEEVVLRFTGQEVTIARFRIDAEGKLNHNSFHRIPKSIVPRTGGS